MFVNIVVTRCTLSCVGNEIQSCVELVYFLLDFFFLCLGLINIKKVEENGIIKICYRCHRNLYFQVLYSISVKICKVFVVFFM